SVTVCVITDPFRHSTVLPAGTVMLAGVKLENPRSTTWATFGAGGPCAGPPSPQPPNANVKATSVRLFHMVLLLDKNIFGSWIPTLPDDQVDERTSLALVRTPPLQG